MTIQLTLIGELFYLYLCISYFSAVVIKHYDHGDFTEFIWGLFPSDRVHDCHDWQHGSKQVGMAEAVAEILLLVWREHTNWEWHGLSQTSKPTPGDKPSPTRSCLLIFPKQWKPNIQIYLQGNHHNESLLKRNRGSAIYILLVLYSKNLRNTRV